MRFINGLDLQIGTPCFTNTKQTSQINTICFANKNATRKQMKDRFQKCKQRMEIKKPHFAYKWIGVGISWHLTIRFDSDSVVNDSILNRLSILHRLSILNRLSIINSKPIKRLSMHVDFQSLKSLPTLCLIIKENQQMNYLLYFFIREKAFPCHNYDFQWTMQ